ncbi:MAG: hypothetical protein SGARI_008038, partial [Bacillariaceae sp.]
DLNKVPTTADMVWVTNEEVQSVADVDGYNMRLNGDSFKKFIMKHATAGVRGGNRQLSSMFDYSAEGITSITCRWCGHPDDDRRLSESVSLEQELIQTEEFKKFEGAMCSSIINKGDFASASGCRVAVSNCMEGGVAAASDVRSYLVSDMRAAPKEGVLFVLENGN